MLHRRPELRQLGDRRGRAGSLRRWRGQAVADASERQRLMSVTTVVESRQRPRMEWE